MWCPRCGVQLEPDRTRCPLCGEARLSAEPVDVGEYVPLPPPALDTRWRGIVRRVALLVAGTASVAVALVDRIVVGYLSWSPYALIPIVAAALMVVAVSLRRAPAVRVGGVFAIASMMLIGLDALDGIAWFVPVALPILAAAAIVCGVAALVLPRMPGAIRSAVVLALAAAVCVAVDGAIVRYRSGTPELGWSLVVLVAAVPGALFLLTLELTVLRVIDLRRRFHL